MCPKESEKPKVGGFSVWEHSKFFSCKLMLIGFFAFKPFWLTKGYLGMLYFEIAEETCGCV